VSVFEGQRGPLHLLHEVLPVFLVLVGRDEHHLQLVPVLGGLLERAVEVPEAGVELAARRVLATAEVEAEQGHSAGQRLHVHLGLLLAAAAAHQPLSQQTHQELRHLFSNNPLHKKKTDWCLFSSLRLWTTTTTSRLYLRRTCELEPGHRGVVTAALPADRSLLVAGDEERRRRGVEECAPLAAPC